MRDVVVIGAGLVGLSTAYFLRRHGLEVTVVDGAAGPATGASFGNGGYLQATVADPWNFPGALRFFAQAWVNDLAGRADRSPFVTRTLALPGLVGWGLKFLKAANTETYLANTIANTRLCQYSVLLTKEVAATERFVFGQSDAGALIIFQDEAAMEKYVALADQVARQDTDFSVLDRSALLAAEPSLSAVGDRLVGAVHFPGDYAGNSRRFCSQMVAAMCEQGAVFEFGTPVEGIDSKGKAVEVVTPSGTLSADACVIAAGNGASALARPLGVRLPIAPAKGFSLTVPMGDWLDRPRHTIIDMAQHAGVNPLGDELRVSGGAEFAGMRPGISKQRIDYLVGLVRELYPEFADTISPEACDPWSGHRPMSADGIPIIGATSVRNVYVNCGHGGLGWSQSLGSGKALADVIAGGVSEFDITAFSPDRFA